MFQSQARPNSRFLWKVRLEASLGDKEQNLRKGRTLANHNFVPGEIRGHKHSVGVLVYFGLIELYPEASISLV